MNRFNLMTYTAAIALALSACASATKPGAHYAQRQQLLLASAVDAWQEHQRGAPGRRTAGGGRYC